MTSELCRGACNASARGGMGIVYEAEQRAPRRRVALKLLEAGLGSSGRRGFRSEAEVLARLTHENIARVHAAGAEDIEFAPGETRTVVFSVQATRAPAALRLRAEVRGKGIASHEELELPILPARPLVQETRRVALAEGDLDIGAALVSAGWTPGTDQSRLWVTANAEADALSHLAYVAHYPYGCVEQTTSATRASSLCRRRPTSSTPIWAAPAASTT